MPPKKSKLFKKLTGRPGATGLFANKPDVSSYVAPARISTRTSPSAGPASEITAAKPSAIAVPRAISPPSVAPARPRTVPREEAARPQASAAPREYSASNTTATSRKRSRVPTTSQVASLPETDQQNSRKRAASDACLDEDDMAPNTAAAARKRSRVSAATEDHDFQVEETVKAATPAPTEEAQYAEIEGDFAPWSDFESESEYDPDPEEIISRRAALRAAREPTPLLDESIGFKNPRKPFDFYHESEWPKMVAKYGPPGYQATKERMEEKIRLEWPWVGVNERSRCRVLAEESAKECAVNNEKVTDEMIEEDLAWAGW